MRQWLMQLERRKVNHVLHVGHLGHFIHVPRVGHLHGIAHAQCFLYILYNWTNATGGSKVESYK